MKFFKEAILLSILSITVLIAQIGLPFLVVESSNLIVIAEEEAETSNTITIEDLFCDEFKMPSIELYAFQIVFHIDNFNIQPIHNELGVETPPPDFQFV